MNKNIVMNFIFPPDKEGADSVQSNIKRFYGGILTAYINNLNCGYDDKKRIVECIALLCKENRSG